jgi:hypothetical protein
MIKLTISLHWPPLAMLPGTPARCSASGEVDEASATAAIQLATAREQESKKKCKTTSRSAKYRARNAFPSGPEIKSNKLAKRRQV